MVAHLTRPADASGALQALEKAREQALPIEAVGRTRAEVVAIYVKRSLIMLGIYAVLTTAIVIGLSSEGGGMAEGDARALATAFPLMGLGFAAAFALVVMWFRSRACPDLRVTVDAEAVRVGRQGEEHVLPHDSLDFTIRSWSGGPRYPITAFAGVHFDSPIGPVKLEGRWFHNGAEAAAAIVHQADLRGQLWPPEGEEPRWPY